MNQQDMICKRRKINLILMALLVFLSLWLAREIAEEAKRFFQRQKPLTAQRISIKRKADELIIDYQNPRWMMVKPYAYQASEVVVHALLDKIKKSCRLLSEKPQRTPVLYADIFIDKALYQIGELNIASDENYLKHDNHWYLCDKILLAMAQAPAINYIDKRLYRGNLTAIVGDFGRLTSDLDLDLSVLEIAPADEKALPKQAISALHFVSEGNTQSYQAFLSDDSRYLLLFDAKKSLIYVIRAQKKLNAILGL